MFIMCVYAIHCFFQLRFSWLLLLFSFYELRITQLKPCHWFIYIYIYIRVCLCTCVVYIYVNMYVYIYVCVFMQYNPFQLRFYSCPTFSLSRITQLEQCDSSSFVFVRKMAEKIESSHRNRNPLLCWMHSVYIYIYINRYLNIIIIYKFLNKLTNTSIYTHIHTYLYTAHNYLTLLFIQLRAYIYIHINT